MATKRVKSKKAGVGRSRDTLPKRDQSFPAYGQIWDYRGAQVCILGNSIEDDGEIWAADWATGQRVDAFVDELTPLAITETDTFELVVTKCCEWAKTGNADAAWWLNWRFDGVNLPRSVWYYIAALRLNPDDYWWAFERIIADSRYGVMCAGTPQPDIAFLLNIPEFKGESIGEWTAAIQEAETAIHQPATQSQLDLAMTYIAKGMSARAASFKANITELFLTNSSEYRSWSDGQWNTSLHQKSKQADAIQDE